MNVKDLLELIDLEEDQFKVFCEDKNVGYLMGLQNLLKMTYNEVSKAKDDLVKSMAEIDPTPTHESTLNGLYSKLLRTEHRSFLLQELITEKTV